MNQDSNSPPPAATSTPASAPAGVPVLSDTREPFSFVVIGDTHYERPDFAEAKLVHAVAADLHDSPPDPAPAMIFHTGDMVEGGSYASNQNGKTVFHLADYAAMKQELSFAMRDLTESFRLPLFVALGSHDQHDPGHRAADEEIRPVLSRELGVKLSHAYYALRYGNSCFVVLEQVPEDYAGQARFAQEIFTWMARAKEVEHVFVFCHGALWEAYRPGFDNPPLTESILASLKLRGPDAWFCGHTHNVATTVCDISGLRLAQIQGVMNNTQPPLLPIEQARATLLEPARLPYAWGYVEGRGPRGAYYVVTVRGRDVRVRLRAPGAGVVREFAWSEVGKLRDLKVPPSSASARVTAEMLHQAKSARLVFCPWSDRRIQIGLTLGGQTIAPAAVDPVYCPFWNERFIEIPKAQLALLKPTNDVTITNPAKAFFALSSARLEVTLADGSVVSTAVADKFYFASTQAQAAANDAGKAVLQSWKDAPAHRIREVNLGEPLGPMTLKFGAGE